MSFRRIYQLRFLLELKALGKRDEGFIQNLLLFKIKRLITVDSQNLLQEIFLAADDLKRTETLTELQTNIT